MGVTSALCTAVPHPKTSESAELGSLESVLKMLERVLERTTLPASEPRPEHHSGIDPLHVKSVETDLTRLAPTV